MANKNDIELGDGKIVDWIEIDFQIQKPFSVDKIVKPIMPFFGYLETVCVHECCGVDAFDFSEKSIREAAINFDVDGQLFYFLEVYEKLKALNAEVFEVTRMNYNFAKNVFLELLTHIIESLKKNK
ncbi:MAG: DUF6331 family protein [Saprospiraceae bacterium]